MFPDVLLMPPSREDVQRMADWLNDDEVSSLWYGRGDDGWPLHTGYSPHRILQASDAEWSRVFDNQDRKIFSIYIKDGEHVGEAQLAIQWALQEAQLFIIIGDKGLWHQHYGTIALIHLLDRAYETYELHRVWADVPDYNEHALQMLRHLGFVLEGHLRKTHRKDDIWYDSYAMGLLTDEYTRRRSRLMGATSS